MDSVLNEAYASVVLGRIGFECPSESRIPAKLKKVVPKGLTAFRDSVQAGCATILKITSALEQFKV